MSIEDTDFVEVMRDGVAYKATIEQLNAALGPPPKNVPYAYYCEPGPGEQNFAKWTVSSELLKDGMNRKQFTYSTWLKRKDWTYRHGFIFVGRRSESGVSGGGHDTMRVGHFNVDEGVHGTDHGIVINDYGMSPNCFFKTDLVKNNNWFHLGEHLIGDHKSSDEGIVDLLLHCQDRSYNVSELYEWINVCGLNIVEFTPQIRCKYKYNIPELELNENNVNKYSINELFFGDIIKHNIYITKNIRIPSINNLNYSMSYVLILKDDINTLLQEYMTHKWTEIQCKTTLKYKFHDGIWSLSTMKDICLNFKINDIIYIILKNIDGIKTTKDIFQIVRNELKLCIDNEYILNIWKPVYEQFNLYDCILLHCN